MDKNSSAYSMCLNVYCISRKSCPIFIVYFFLQMNKTSWKYNLCLHVQCVLYVQEGFSNFHGMLTYSFKISRTYCMFFYESLFTAWSTFQLEVCVYVYGLHTVELRSFIYLRRPPCFPILL